MQFVSTRGTQPVNLDTALVNGIADDGGLYVPAELPLFNVDDFVGANSLRDVAEVLLAPFFEGSSLQKDLPAILEETFKFPIPVTPISSPSECVG